MSSLAWMCTDTSPAAAAAAAAGTISRSSEGFTNIHHPYSHGDGLDGTGGSAPQTRPARRTNKVKKPKDPMSLPPRVITEDQLQEFITRQGAIFPCDWPGCDRLLKSKQQLKMHRRHHGFKWAREQELLCHDSHDGVAAVPAFQAVEASNEERQRSLACPVFCPVRKLRGMDPD
eukprot:c20420_g1_i1.p1 GENE.c20420_g1_i1~~c20420_g1_i1.p1  ORF type:complete len:198 (-),score=24.98 c20420_g1_i1:309-830(-)